MLSILIPAYNESDSIQTTIQQLRRVMDGLDNTYEIIVIDDGSQDNTAELARASGVRVIRHPANAGYGRALKTGMQHAAYEWCAIVDADGSYPLDDFPALLEHIPAFDMVVGARTGKIYWGPLGKRIGRYALRIMVNFVTGSSIPDVNSGMRIFRKDLALAHSARISSGFSFTATLTLAMLLEEHFVHYVPIGYSPRVGKSKVKILPDTLRMIQILTQAILFYNPLKLFLLIILAAVGVGLVAALLGVFLDLAAGGWILFASILIAIVLGGMGFLAEAIRLHRISR